MGQKPAPGPKLGPKLAGPQNTSFFQPVVAAAGAFFLQTKAFLGKFTCPIPKNVQKNCVCGVGVGYKYENPMGDLMRHDGPGPGPGSDPSFLTQRNIMHLDLTPTPCQVPSTRYQVPGAWYLVPGTRYQVPGTRYLVPGTRYQVPGTRYLLRGTSYHLPGGRSQVPVLR